VPACIAVEAGVGAAAPASCPSIAMKSTLRLEGAFADDVAGAAAPDVGVLATGMEVPAKGTLGSMISSGSRKFALGALIAFALLASFNHMALFGLPALDYMAQRLGTFQGVLPL